MVKPFLDQVNGRVTDDVNLFTGGLNTYVDKAFIEANQLPFCMNMAMQQPPCMQTRPFRQTLAEYFPNGKYPGGERDIRELYVDTRLGTFAIIREHDDGLDEDIGVLYKYNFENGTIDRLQEIGLLRDNYYFCHCWQATTHYLYVMTNYEKYKLEFTGTTIDSITPITDGFYGIPEFHKGRLFLADPSTNIVTFSALYDFDNFDQTPTVPPDYSVIAGDFKITNGIGQIVGTKSFDDKLYIFCESSIHLLYGNTPDPSLSGFFQLVDLNNGIGAYSNRCIAVGGNRLFFLGSDHQVYEHTGSSLYMISRPITEHGGGIDNIFNRTYLGNYPQMCAGNSKLYLNVPSNWTDTGMNEILFVYDIYNKIWWAEDGQFTSIAMDVMGSDVNQVFMALPTGDIVNETDVGIGGTIDYLYSFEEEKIFEAQIRYAFQTRVYGIDGVDMRKTVSDVWFQATANAEVYLGELWTVDHHWDRLPWTDDHLDDYIKIGEIKQQAETSNEIRYTTDTSEQQRCIIPKMFGQRVNGFSVLVTGLGNSKFYLMKRNWRVS